MIPTEKIPIASDFMRSNVHTISADMPLADIAARVHLSPTPCWRRIQKLRDAGVIRKQVALCDAQQLNVGVTVFVSVRTREHTQA